MKKDIENRADIDRLLTRFYEEAFADDLIGFIFTDVAKLDLEHHLPIIGDFWESLLLGTNAYQKHQRNPMQIHAVLNMQTPLLPKHFRRWVEIFERIVDDLFDGERAEFAKLRAEAIANRMLNYVSNVPGIGNFNGSDNRAEIPANPE
jgi:hemoglobin